MALALLTRSAGSVGHDTRPAGRDPSSESGSRLVPGASGPGPARTAGVAAAVAGLALGLRPLYDNSFLTHLATGRLILSGHLPSTDPYSFTATGHPWTVESWLADAGIALAQRIGGGHAVQLFHALLTALIAGATWRLTRAAGSVPARAAAVAPVLIIGAHTWTGRPLVVALLLLAALTLLVDEDRGSPWWLIPFMWIWVNVHGSWVLGPGYLALRLVGRALDRRTVDRRALGRLPAQLGWAVVGCAAAALNPLGPRLLLFPLKVMTDRRALSMLKEWGHPTLTSVGTLAVVATVLLALYGAYRRRSLEDGLVAAVFGTAALLAERNLAAATIVVAPVAARALARPGHRMALMPGRAAAAAAAVCVSTAAVVTLGAMRAPAYDLSAYPVHELAWADGHGLLRGSVATPDFVGNYLEAWRGIRARVFVDDRYDMFPLAVLQDYETLVQGGAAWASVLDRYRITTVVWPRSAALAERMQADRRWQDVRPGDRTWLIAVRTGPPQAGAPANPQH